MPIDLHDELDDGLSDIARALVAEAPDVPVFHRAAGLQLSAAGRSTAWRALAAATVIAVAGAGGLYLLRDRDDTDDTATIPVVPGDINWPALLPIVEGGADGYVYAFPIDSFRVAQATLAKHVDGALVDPVVVEVGTDYEATHGGPDREPADIVGVFGRTAHVYTSLDDLTPLAVVIGEDPYVAVSGVDPMAFLNRADEDFVRYDVPDDGGPISLEFGELPEGYEVIYNEPEPDEATAFVWMDVTSSSSEEVFVTVGVGPVMIGRDAAPVDVNGTTAWLSTDGAHSDVTWPVEGETFATVRANSPVETLDIARSLQFVPLDEWAAHYDVDVEAVAPGPPVSF